jgi:hypothetical protein
MRAGSRLEQRAFVIPPAAIYPLSSLGVSTAAAGWNSISCLIEAWSERSDAVGALDSSELWA